MYCDKCGNSNDSNAKNCTNCGKEIGIPDNVGSITFFRSKRFYGSMIKIKVFIDGKQVCSLGNGQEIKVPVSIGTHKVMFDLWSGNAGDEIHITKENPNVKATVKLKIGAVTSKPEIVDLQNIEEGVQQEYTCKKCGCNLNIDSAYCVNCGEKTNIEVKESKQVEESNIQDSSNKFNTIAIISFVVALVNIFIINLWIALITLGLSVAAMQKVKAFNQKGKGLAISALVISIIELVIWVFYLVAAMSFYGLTH